MLHHRLFARVSVSKRFAAPICLVLALQTSCRHTSKDASKDAGGAKYIPIASERIDAVNNASKQPLYDGPVGSVEGTVTISGDDAPDMLPYIDKIPPECDVAKQTYGKLFREGPGRTVADVLVAVTGFKGYVRSKSEYVELEARNCAWAKKTVGVTFGQRIEAKSKDTRAYIPQLLGGTAGALLVAVPGGESVPVFPQEPGHYVLIDSMRLYSKADVFVVRYPTFDVTGESGRYRIDNIPVGPVTISALLPSTSGTISRPINVTANEVTKVDLALTFSASSFRPSTPAPRPSN